MGKVFITDEVNDSYTADVTSVGNMKVETGASSHYKISGVPSSASYVLSTTPCWLKSVIIGSLPATASSVNLYDTATSAASGAEASGANHIAKFIIQPAAAAATAQVQNYVIPLNVYCTTGLSYGLGQDGTNIGVLSNVTIIYQT
jgi:hypothetical protein